MRMTTAKLAIAIYLFTACAVGIKAQTIYSLNSPQPVSSITSVHLQRFEVLVEQQAILIAWRDSNGTVSSVTYSTPAPANRPGQPTGLALIGALNKANFSGVNPSLETAIINRLVTDGYLPAVTPQ